MRRLLALLPSVVLVLSTTPASADVGDELLKFLPDSGGLFADFGHSVAISGNITIVGAYEDDANGPDSGSAYLFDSFDPANPTLIAKLRPSDAAAGDRFGSAVAISGQTGIVGAFQDDDNGTDSGSAYLFDATTGQQIAKLLAIDGAEGDRFGHSVAISGTTAIVGALWDDDNGNSSGSAYLFDTATGQQIAKLLANDGAEGDLFGRSVAISGTTAIVGANQDDDNGDRSGAAYLFDATTGRQIAKLLPDDGEAFDQFGFSVAINGTTAIVGAAIDSEEGFFASGSAYLFDISDPTNPTQIAKLLPDDGAAFDQFGYSVAISGTTANVGAKHDDDNGTNSGSAYLFDISDPTNPTQIAKLLPDDGAAHDKFGISVAVSGTTAIVGAELDDHNGFDSGSTYFFDTITGQQIAKLLRPSDAEELDLFGGSVAISSSRAIIGAHGHDHMGTDSGSAYVFNTAGGYGFPFFQLDELLANDGAAGDEFGISVAISGDICIVGAHLDDDNGDASGSAYLFETFEDQPIAKLLPDDGTEGDRFGISVAMSNTIAIVGAWLDDDNGLDSGSAYLFDTATGQQIGKLLADDGAADDRFGISVSISGETAIVGAYRDDDNGPDSGSAYVFDISDPTNPAQIAKLLPEDGAAGDQFGASVAISGTTAVVGSYGDNDNGINSGSAYLFDAPCDSATPNQFDFDGDDDIDAADLAILLGSWGPCPEPCPPSDTCPADFDGNCAVGPFDLAMLLGFWGPCP